MLRSAYFAARALAAAFEASALSQAQQSVPCHHPGSETADCNSALAVGCQASVSWISPADSAKRFTVQESRSHSTEISRK